MFERDETVLVAVSGGKDSLALWDVLIDEGYRTTGLYLDLGIFDYSVESRAKCEAFAAKRDVPLLVRRVADEVGAPVPVIKQVTRRPPCSGCGLSKRYLMCERIRSENSFSRPSWWCSVMSRSAVARWAARSNSVSICRLP